VSKPRRAPSCAAGVVGNPATGAKRRSPVSKSGDPRGYYNSLFYWTMLWHQGEPVPRAFRTAIKRETATGLPTGRFVDRAFAVGEVNARLFEAARGHLRGAQRGRVYRQLRRCWDPMDRQAHY